MKNKTPSFETRIRHAFAVISLRRPICSKVFMASKSGPSNNVTLRWLEARPIDGKNRTFTLTECRDVSFTGIMGRVYDLPRLDDNKNPKLYSYKDMMREMERYEAEIKGAKNVIAGAKIEPLQNHPFPRLALDRLLCEPL
jgi:hypothetical protein